VTVGSPESPGELTVGIIDMPKSPVKFPHRCGETWFHYHNLITGISELPNYDIALFRNGYNLVTAGSPESPGELTVGIIDVPESTLKFPRRCGAS
jgi:hypothetical protein